MKNTCKYQPSISHDDPVAVVENDNSNSGKFDTSGLITAIGGNVDSLLELFKKPDTYNTYNVTTSDESKKDNTMLYVGIGGVVLVVLLFVVIALKK